MVALIFAYEEAGGNGLQGEERNGQKRDVDKEINKEQGGPDSFSDKQKQRNGPNHDRHTDKDSDKLIAVMEDKEYENTDKNQSDSPGGPKKDNFLDPGSSIYKHDKLQAGEGGTPVEINKNVKSYNSENKI